MCPQVDQVLQKPQHDWQVGGPMASAERNQGLVRTDSRACSWVGGHLQERVHGSCVQSQAWPVRLPRLASEGKRGRSSSRHWLVLAVAQLPSEGPWAGQWGPRAGLAAPGLLTKALNMGSPVFPLADVKLAGEGNVNV